jgi:hypothetical protein
MRRGEPSQWASFRLSPHKPRVDSWEGSLTPSPFSMGAIRKGLMMTTIEKESTKLADVEWTATGKLVAKFYDGDTADFNPALASVALHDEAKRYGWAVKYQRLGAVSATDFPTRKARKEEYKRRWMEFRTHVYSGTDQWDLPRGPRATGPNEADMVESIDRVYPGRGQAILTASIKKENGDLKAATAKLLGTEQIRKAWGDLQAERRASAAKGLPSADDYLSELGLAE